MIKAISQSYRVLFQWTKHDEVLVPLLPFSPLPLGQSTTVKLLMLKHRPSSYTSILVELIVSLSHK